MDIIKTISLFILLVLLANCSSKQEVISLGGLDKYYFPIEELKEAKVYHYKNEIDSEPDLFWKLSVKADDEKTFFITESYSYSTDNKLIQIEEIKEEITEQGSFVVEYIQYEHDDYGNVFKLNSVLEDNCVFLWRMNSKDKITWTFHHESKVFNELTRNATKTRQLKNIDKEVNIFGNKHKAIVFNDEIDLEYTYNETNQVESSYPSLQVSCYAKGVGMVSYNRKFKDGSEVTYMLEKIMPFDEWSESFGGV